MEINQLLESLKLEEYDDMVIIYDLEAHANRLLNSIETLSLRGKQSLPWQSNAQDFYLFLENQIKNKAQYQFNKVVGFSDALNHNPQIKLFKTQVIYSKDQDLKINIGPYTRNIQKEWKVSVVGPEEFPIEAKDPGWKHKFYPRLDLDLQGYDEIIRTNEEGLICEGSFTNIFFQDEKGNWHTPHLDCNILPGIMRSKLIKELNATEGFYSKNDIKGRVLLMSSMFIKEAEIILI